MTTETTQTLVAEAAMVGKPTWMRWFCSADDLWWDGAERDCWFCGMPGRRASPPRLTSQHGWDEGGDWSPNEQPELALTDRMY